MARHPKFISVLISIPFFAASAAFAQEAALPACSSFPNGAESYACTCESGFIAGSIWGTGIYTTDSSICTAAQHVGAITPAGGKVQAVSAGAQEGFKSSTQNGITSQEWGAFDRSFMFVNPNLVLGVAANSDGPLEACSALAPGQDRVSCSCAAGSASLGGVWGSGPYTADSNICAAAQHAGVIGPDGGTVTALRGPGVPNYSASQANGISSSPWENYDSSLMFDRN